MAGDPKECREQAASCWALVEKLDEQEKEPLGDLARAWEQLAVEHESAQAFLKTMEAIMKHLERDVAPQTRKFLKRPAN